MGEQFLNMHDTYIQLEVGKFLRKKEMLLFGFIKRRGKNDFSDHYIQYRYINYTDDIIEQKEHGKGYRKKIIIVGGKC